MKQIILISLIILAAHSSGSAQINQDKTAPDFVLSKMSGKNYQLSENLGQGPILINFWATWCIPCHEEMKKLKKIYEKYHEQGLDILAISVDDTKTVSSVPGFINARKYPFTVLLDTNNEVMQLYQANTPPFTVLIDRAGRIVYTHSGYRKGDEIKIEKEITALLGKE